MVLRIAEINIALTVPGCVSIITHNQDRVEGIKDKEKARLAFRLCGLIGNFADLFFGGGTQVYFYCSSKYDFISSKFAREQLMKKSRSLCLLLTYFIVLFHHHISLADLWGYDIILAAPYQYGWEATISGENCEGVLFPAYLGYVSFDDRGDTRVISFTPNIISELPERIRLLTRLFKNMNESYQRNGPAGFNTLDEENYELNFYSSMFTVNIYPVLSLPVGTAKDFDFAYIEQLPFSFEEADQQAKSNMLYNSPEESGLFEDNLSMTPKE